MDRVGGPMYFLVWEVRYPYLGHLFYLVLCYQFVQRDWGLASRGCASSKRQRRFHSPVWKMKLHADFLKTCIEEDIIPKGLTVDLTSTLEDKDNEIFNNKWKQILKNCSRELMSCLVEHYERQITLNATVIADTYESLDKVDGWTERDKQQLEEEMKLIIDDKEQKLKESKQKKCIYIYIRNSCH